MRRVIRYRVDAMSIPEEGETERHWTLSNALGRVTIKAPPDSVTAGMLDHAFQHSLDIEMAPREPRR